MRPIAALIGLLLVTGCTTAPATDVEARIAQVEARTASLEAALAGGGAEDAAASDGTASAEVAAGGAAAPAAKETFAAEVAEAEVALKADLGLDADAVVRFDDRTDTVLVRAAGDDEDDGDADLAWEVAQALAPLWEEVGGYQPVLDLGVGDVRCACSAALMQELHAGTADRAVWEGACETA